ncbi:MAG: phosphoenolpyruvate carboxykinase (ATP) [Thermoleophilia bacterium]|nr:phosphoenolpyruvate carboxykinase (ATP) [Thermoleophilia bacterium]
MSTTTGAVGLDAHGVTTAGTVYGNPTTEELYEHALRRGEGVICEGGAFLVNTAPNTGRSPKDKFTVREAGSEDRVWWGPNQPIAPANNDVLRGDLAAHLSDGRELFVLDAFAGSHPEHRLALRLVSDSAWHVLFARTMFIPATPEEIAVHVPQALILHSPSFQADPATHGTNSSGFVTLNLTTREILIGGTRYGGEIKKSIFTLMNDRLPETGVLSMHCSANVNSEGRVAVFFGLSGTGKTTLSTDPERALIGDDEHGWADDGVFNIENGCYAKIINLSAESEPEIFATTTHFGTVIENAVMNPVSRRLDLDDDSITENTRAAYTLTQIPGSVPEKRAGIPSTVVMLTADAFGVLPPIARLTPEQAMFHFLSGYTAKLAGTEVGVTEPQTTFSTCFGAPFLPQRPNVYAEMLGERLDKTGATAWLVNTGWTGGAYGVGSRMPIKATRLLVRAAIAGDLDHAETRQDPIFGLHVPVNVPGVDPALLDPKQTWPDPAAFDDTARKLAAAFRDNFTQYEAMVSAAVIAAGPIG